MLSELGIYAVSVELGGSKSSTRKFFIRKEDDLKEILLETEPWVTATTSYIMPRVKCELTQSYKTDKKYERVNILTAFEC